MEKSVIQRFTPVYEGNTRHVVKNLWKHLTTHFELTDLSSIVSCPLSTSTPDSITATCSSTRTSVADLSQRLLEAHGWNVKQGQELDDHDKEVTRMRDAVWQRRKQNMMTVKRMEESKRIKTWYLAVLIPILGSVQESLLRRSHRGTRVIVLVWKEVICFSCIMLRMCQGSQIIYR
jgi:formyltetrahydrofolate hydrolase